VKQNVTEADACLRPAINFSTKAILNKVHKLNKNIKKDSIRIINIICPSQR